MSKRPTSITVIAWILLTAGAVRVLGLLMSIVNPPRWTCVPQTSVPVAVYDAFTIGGIVVLIVCGYSLLRGKNWSRYLYVGWHVAGILFGLATSPGKTFAIPSTFLLLVMAYLLFRPPANAFFAEGGAGVAEPSWPSMRRVISICLYAVAGFSLLTTCVMALASSTSVLADLALLALSSLPALLILAIGRVVSQAPCWSGEVGTVLVTAAGAAAFLGLSLAIMSMDPGFQQGAPSAEAARSVDYATGIAWTMLIGVLGAIEIAVARKKRESARQAAVDAGDTDDQTDGNE